MITIKDAEKMADIAGNTLNRPRYDHRLIKAWQDAGLVEPCLKSKLLELTDIIDNEYGEKYDDDRIYELTQMIKDYFEEQNNDND
jgi:hypothetical protein